MKKRTRKRISCIEKIHNNKILLAKEYARENGVSLKLAIKEIEFKHECIMLEVRERMDNARMSNINLS